METATERDT